MEGRISRGFRRDLEAFAHECGNYVDEFPHARTEGEFAELCERLQHWETRASRLAERAVGRGKLLDGLLSGSVDRGDDRVHPALSDVLRLRFAMWHAALMCKDRLRLELMGSRAAFRDPAAPGDDDDDTHAG